MAPACIQCGAPLPRPHADAAAVVTTEQTGKKFKGAQLAGVLMIIAGVVSCSSGPGGDPRATAWLWMGGVALYLGARVGAWWHHG
jgi:MYXO-CTERM domain-containing protein